MNKTHRPLPKMEERRPPVLIRQPKPVGLLRLRISGPVINSSRGNSKSCPFRGNDKGAQFLDPDSRTMRGWNAPFYKKKARCAKDGSWAKLSPAELRYVNDYL